MNTSGSNNGDTLEGLLIGNQGYWNAPFKGQFGQMGYWGG